MEKKDIRGMMISKRNEFPFAKEETKNIVKQILNDDNFINAKVVSLYYPFGSEIDVTSIMKEYPSKRYVFPKIVNNAMIFVEVNDKTTWVKHKYGMQEPLDGNILNKIDYMVTPLLAFNKRNARVGYGKGYYDRFLFKHDVKYQAGVAYSFQYYEFKEDDYDYKLNKIIVGEH